ncbi:unnamed protein product, partial [Trichogramma brassicae]
MQQKGHLKQACPNRGSSSQKQRVQSMRQQDEADGSSDDSEHSNTTNGVRSSSKHKQDFFCLKSHEVNCHKQTVKQKCADDEGNPMSPAYLMYKRELRTRFDLLRPNLEETVEAHQRAQIVARPGSRKMNFKQGDDVMIENYGVRAERRIGAEIVKKVSPFHVSYIYSIDTKYRHRDITAHIPTPDLGSRGAPASVPTEVSYNAENGVKRSWLHETRLASRRTR